MSVASRIFSLLRSQALSASREVFSRVSQRPQPPPTDDRPAAESSTGSRARSAAAGAADLETYYANLEIPYGAGLDEVKAAWKRQALRYHPDRHGSDPARQAIATELLQGINHAYSELRRHLESSER